MILRKAVPLEVAIRLYDGAHTAGDFKTAAPKSPRPILFAEILKKLDYKGTCCFNFKIEDGAPRIFEINPRFGGSLWRNINACLNALRDFHRAAGSIDLRGASARQVRRGLYADGVSHWRHYREELAPVLPTLAPWVAHFGYPLE
jgi:hypothetical protein